MARLKQQAPDNFAAHPAASSGEDGAEAQDEDEQLQQKAASVEQAFAGELQEELAATDQADGEAAVSEEGAEGEPSRPVSAGAAADSRAMREIMMPKRNRRLYQRIQHSREKKKAENEKLMMKRVASAKAGEK